MKNYLMALGVAAEEFKSFPSGHTGNAACAILLVILPLVCQKLKGKENIPVSYTHLDVYKRQRLLKPY